MPSDSAHSMNWPGSTRLPLSSRRRTRISQCTGAQVGQAHHRLGVEHQAVVVQHVAQLVGPLHAAVGAAQALRVLVVEHAAVAAAVLGLVHGDVDVGEQRRRRRCRGTDTARCRSRPSGSTRAAGRRPGSGSGAARRARARRPWWRCRAGPRAGAPRTRRRPGGTPAPLNCLTASLQHAAHADDQLIARAMAEVVVDVLEVVDVDEQHRADVARPAAPAPACAAGSPGWAAR